MFAMDMNAINTRSEIEIHETKPIDFKVLAEIAACYIEINGKILLLQQGLKKQETGAWGVPAGKIESHETPNQAASRELMEETGIRAEAASQFQSLGCLYIRKPGFDYVFHLFQVKLEKVPPVCLSHEHQSYQWIDLQHLNNIQLMLGAKEAIEHYQKRLLKARRATADGNLRSNIH